MAAWKGSGGNKVPGAQLGGEVFQNTGKVKLPSASGRTWHEADIGNIESEVMVMVLEIDGTKIRTISDFHAAMASMLDLGSYYRPNLAALWDILSTDVERPVQVIWRNSNASRAAMGSLTFDPVRDLLLRVQAQDEEFRWDERFTVCFE
ncbi:barstar family protein [Streptomyces sp. NPDC088551]|uniref:barstar family protein n=1 Tax=Streptomyces sp. NPDC088551 TaxID=3365863 RepID=UPI0038298D9C